MADKKLTKAQREKNAIAYVEHWFEEKGWKAHAFQKQAWKHYLKGDEGIVNAPTGSGKTYSLGFAMLIEYLSSNKPQNHGLQMIWITPLRALSIEIKQSLERIINDFDIPWQVAVRNGDTSSSDRQKQRRAAPQILITTPESLHLLLASKGYTNYFKHLKLFVVDEWHELIGSKRGVQIELALSRLRTICPHLRTWGISATIGNLEEAMQVLLGNGESKKQVLIKANIKKKIKVIPILPSESETLPWGGHLGIKLAKQILPVLEKSASTLIFTNTRSQAEIWYSHLLEIQPDLAGIIAMHHGSIAKETRAWVEQALHDGMLKAVVCTSSLDLGVDFRPVETVVQIGSPKGIARFMQRAGRSNHSPGKQSEIYFLPTNALELIECSALQDSINQNQMEARLPYQLSLDVLMQYLITLGVSEGFDPKETFEEIQQTFAYQALTYEEFIDLVQFIVTGGEALSGYDEYKKLVKNKEGKYVLEDRRQAMRHRLGIGTIVSDVVLQVKFQKGGMIGSIEEYFVSKLKRGDTFQFAGRLLEFIRIKDLQVQVKLSNKKEGVVPSWQGSRMPLSSQMSSVLRKKITQLANNEFKGKEDQFLMPLFELQRERSKIPTENELLIEKLKTRDGYHVFIYPFEGRLVHEGLAALLAHRIGQIKPLSFSLSYNDYGFELYSDQEIPIEEALNQGIFHDEDLFNDMVNSINSGELAKRKFREIASISGLVFKGYPGKNIKTKHIQASSSLIFDVLEENNPNNPLIRQAYDEVFQFELEEIRLRTFFNRLKTMDIVVKQLEKYSPLSFPIMVERIRGSSSTEKLIDRIKRLQEIND